MGWNCTIAVVDGATLDDLAGIGWRVTGVTLDWETATTLDNEGFAAWVQDERVVIASGGLELQEQAERLSAVGPVCSALFQSVTDTYEWRMVGPDRRRTWAWSAYELQVDEGEPHPAETDVDRLDEDALFDLLTGVAGLRFDEELEGARFVVLELPGTPEPPAPTKRRRLFGRG